MKESEVQWFRPLWRRLVVTGVVVAWLAYEAIFTHDSLWMTISGAGLAYCVWNFFLTFPKGAPPAAGTPPADPPPGP